jgi:flagellar hook-associated protein 1 FlgK
LDAVGQSFLGITAELNRLTDSIQTDRERADASIAANVDELNASLALIDKLSDDITTIRISGADISALLDQRQLAIDAVSKIIPVQEVSRDNNQIALVSAGGGTLYDSQPAIFSFEKTSTITGELSVINGLGHLKFNGTSVNFLENNPFDGGILEGHFDVRDEFAVQAQTELDEIAASLIDRFQGDDVDPTQTDDVLGIPALGIFTDGGQAFSSGNEAGVAGRISINELVDVSQDGKSQLFRDGLYDEGGSELGDPTQIQNWLGALSTPLSDSALAEATDVFSKIGSRRLISERNFSFENARYETLKQAELSDGVDTDQEMQNLLLIEQAYSANAKVIQTVDEMMQTLLRLGS